MIRLLRILATVSTIGALLSAPLPASAAAAPSAFEGARLYRQLLSSPDPTSAYLALTDLQQESVQLALTVVTAREAPASATAVALAGGCWYAQKGIQGISLAGLVVWQFNSKINWCSNGSVITSKSNQVWPSNMALFWSYDTSNGWPVVHEYGGVNYTYYETWSQAHMMFCPPGTGCVQHQYPWIDLVGYPNGTYSGSAGT